VTGGRFELIAGVVDVDALASRRVVIVGLGSGGSTVALELAKAGVGRLTLVDPDRLEERNVVRHECDDRDLDRRKVDAVADLVARRNPDARVEAIAADVFALGDRLERLVRAADLVAGCTDGEAPQHLLNRLCLDAGVPAVYGGVYERGVGGEVIRCRPGDACYACVSAALKESAPLPDGGELDYGAVDADGRLHGVPGLGLDVRLVALVHAKVCLLTLLSARGGAAPPDEAPPEPAAEAPVDIPANVVLFGTAPVEGLFPRHFASALVTVAPQDGCLVCGPYRVGALASPPPAAAPAI
jgi:molybdopterin/thiamine biosynthesis adenylyltransferase